MQIWNSEGVSSFALQKIRTRRLCVPALGWAWWLAFPVGFLLHPAKLCFVSGAWPHCTGMWLQLASLQQTGSPSPPRTGVFLHRAPACVFAHPLNLNDNPFKATEARGTETKDLAQITPPGRSRMHSPLPGPALGHRHRHPCTCVYIHTHAHTQGKGGGALIITL